ncbi:hypothetical protein AKJ44_02375 [candidate division MSBL1 archaeon SCGC-AAA261F17]|uniref:4-phosphopantoate--beta-alanine ligase n=1 Tax=candidate division MSBL1 archaeon SCGC-AAA261F17 TaxID=1698274 RepID=A0A133V565_9EURY|nr:hypothetical protein AKJ44_02375 [candidate division MSBL1 archaeon SCGC-AAA261F17]
MTEIESDHPRAESLRVREKLVNGFEKGLVVPEGLSAHGRGEAFDYILGEETSNLARKAIETATATLLEAENPVISVNGNTAALVPGEVVELAGEVGAKIEVNLFHRSPEREKLIAEHLISHGASEVLGVEEEFAARIPEIHSDRRKVDERGIKAADVVLVPLEDGDRTEALKELGKTVIAIDLNPMSRTAQAADVTIVDNIVRSLPLMIKEARDLSEVSSNKREGAVWGFDNEQNLGSTINLMLGRLEELSQT